MASGKRVVLTMQQRLDVLKDLETSSILSITRKYNVHHTTIRRIKENATMIAKFAEKSLKEQHRKKIRKPVYKDLEQRLVTWFIERRTMGDILSDMVLMEKAAELKKEIAGCSNFKMSKGWLANFKRRHGIRLLHKYSEKASTEENIAKNGRGEEQDEEQDKEQEDERDGERGAEMDEGSDEVSVEGDGTCERGMKWNNQDREELEDIFNRLERFQYLMPRSARLHIEGLKVLILGDINQRK